MEYGVSVSITRDTKWYIDECYYCDKYAYKGPKVQNLTKNGLKLIKCPKKIGPLLYEINSLAQASQYYNVNNKNKFR